VNVVGIDGIPALGMKGRHGQYLVCGLLDRAFRGGLAGLGLGADDRREIGE
jgi:hypothetical protein